MKGKSNGYDAQGIEWVKKELKNDGLFLTPCF